MRKRVLKFVLAVLFLMVFHGNAIAIWIDSVDVIPTQPLITDIITFNIFGGSSASPCQVAYSQFSQNGTSLLLDLYFPVGVLPTFCEWTYSKQIEPLTPADYSLQVRAFDNYYNMLWDTDIIDFVVIPEPTTLIFFAIGLPVFRIFSKRKI